MTPGFLDFISQAARLIRSGHADDAETLLWRTLEDSDLPTDDGDGDPADAAGKAPESP
jgi:hypothetical protein